MKNRLKRSMRKIKKEIGFYRSVIADPRCPRTARWLLAAALAYALSPIDFVPDFIPVLGQLDDLLILPLLVWLAFRMMPKDLITEYRQGQNGLGE